MSSERRANSPAPEKKASAKGAEEPAPGAAAAKQDTPGAEKSAEPTLVESKVEYDAFGVRKPNGAKSKGGGNTKFIAFFISIFLITAGVGAYFFWVDNALKLDAANWEDLTAGKTVFVKFMAPWCGHCKQLKPAWDKLTIDYKDSPTTLVGVVDCTGTGKSLCTRSAVQGFPSLKYGDPDALQTYEEGRSLADLQKFAANLKPLCSPTNVHLCDAEKTAEIAKFAEMGKEKRQELIENGEAEIAKLETEFKEFTAGLQKSYKESEEQKEAAIKAVKDGGLGLLRAVSAFGKKTHQEL